MNPVQEAVAEFLGFKQELEAQQTAWNTREEEYSAQIESLESTQALLQRQLEDLDYLNLYDVQNITEIFPSASRHNTLLRLRRLRHENPMAKQGVQLIKRFTLGRGVQWTTEHDQVRDVIRDCWRDNENEQVLTSHKAQKELLDDIVTDGERFLAAYSDKSAPPYVKVTDIPTDEIKQIVYHPENHRVPLWYKRTFLEQTFDGKSEQYTPRDSTPKVLYYLDHNVTDKMLEEVADRIKIPKKKQAVDDKGDYVRIFHLFATGVKGKDGVRGVSELYASREWFKVFQSFMEDRAAINAAATAIAAKRKIKGGPTEVAKFKNKLGGVEVGYDQDPVTRRITRPVAGAIYDTSPAVDLDWMKTDTGASQAVQDARLLLMSAAIGMGSSIHYFGEGGDANLATAQAMELPMVKNYEDWQTFWREGVLQEFIKFLLKVVWPDGLPKAALNQPSTEDDAGDVDYDLPGIKATDFDPKHPEDLVAWVFPPIIAQDVVKATTALASLVTQIAKDNVTVQLAVIRQALSVVGIPNIDQILKSAEAEQKQIAKDRKAAADAAKNNLINGQQPPLNGTSGNGSKLPETGFAKAIATGTDASTRRIASGKPPIDHSR